MDSLLFASAVVAITAFASTRQQGAVGKPTKQEDAGKQHASKSATVFLDANRPVDAEGRVHHLHVKDGDVANRVLSVGDVGRAERISKLLDGGKGSIKVTSSRGFVTHTGTYKGVLVSIVATGMGTPMMDFVVRETREVVKGPMAFLRYGTCGGLRTVKPGSVVVAGHGTRMIRREPDAAGDAAAIGAKADAGAGWSTAACPYSVSKLVQGDESLCKLYEENLRASIGSEMSSDDFPIICGADASADSFYSSQGRTNPFFMDNNEQLLDRVETQFPEVCTLEMETFHLFDLARSSKPSALIAASGAAIVLANRRNNIVVSHADLMRLEVLGGKAALETLIAFDLDGLVKRRNAA